jgi:hypothetical protein
MLVVLAVAPAGVGQTITDVARPRLAMAQDGRFAIAFEALIGHWAGGVQLYSPNGTPIGPINFFEGESCSGLDIWTSDFIENVELAFRPDGILLVLMQHSGDFSIGGDFLISAEAAIGAIDASGQRIDLSNGPCSVRKLIFVGGGRQDRPRMALTPNGDVVVTVDGFFQGANLRNVGIRVLDANLDEVIEEVIPHSDAFSEQSFHMFPDIATNGQLILSTWQRCPIVDQQGNANECDIEVQFAAVTNQGLQAVGGNATVNSGDPFGTINIWPAGAMNASGNSVIAWADTRTGFEGDIFGQRFNSNGQAVGGNFQISTSQGDIQGRPEVVMLNSGGFTVAWGDSSVSGFRARARNFDANGNALGGSFELNNPGLQSGSPALSTDGNQVNYVYLASSGGPIQILSNTPAVTAVEEEAPLSESLEIEAYPSPFITNTTLSYRLPETAHVRIEIYDALGRLVRRLSNEVQTAGQHRLSLDGASLPAGAYLVRISAGSETRSRLLLRL